MLKVVLAILVLGALLSGVSLAIWLRRLRHRGQKLRRFKLEKARRMHERRQTAELEYVQLEIDRSLTGGQNGDGPPDLARADRLQELRSVLARSRDLRPVPVPLATVVAGAVDWFRDRLGPGREVTFSAPPGDERPLAMGDRELLDWAVREVLSNVAAHGGTWSRIEVEVSANEGDTRVEIRDDGTGLDPTVASRLYGAFTARAGSPGPGAGLFAVRDIVGRCGGAIEMHRAANGGLVQSIVLPAVRTAARTGPAELTAGA